MTDEKKLRSTFRIGDPVRDIHNGRRGVVTEVMTEDAEIEARPVDEWNIDYRVTFGGLRFPGEDCDHYDGYWANDLIADEEPPVYADVRYYTDTSGAPAGISCTINAVPLFVPMDPDNAHYQRIMALVEAGKLVIADAEAAPAKA